MGLTTPVCSKIPRLRTGTSHVSPIASTLPHYIAISKPLKAQPDGGTPTRQWAGHPGLPTHGLTTPCMLENSQAAHLTLPISLYSIPITLYPAPYIAIFKP